MGTAVVNDLSAVDVNPAGLSAGTAFTFSGETHWINSNIQANEVGVMDPVLSEIAAGVKVRQTTQQWGALHRRYSLGLSERLGGSASPFFFGVAGDYIQWFAPPDDSFDTDVSEITTMDAQSFYTSGIVLTEKTGYRLRAGGVFILAKGFVISATTDGYFDRFAPKKHSLGAAIAFAEYYLGSGDILFVDKTLAQYTAGMTLSAKQYLDLRLGYGYEPQRARHSGSGGVAIKSQQVKIFYTFLRPDWQDSLVYHNVGLSYMRVFQ